MNYLVAYGVDFDYIDVTQIVIDNCINNGIAYIYQKVKIDVLHYFPIIYQEY